MVVHFSDHINTYGSFIGFCVGFTIRLLGGEPYISLPATIHYPFYDYEKGEQNFPFRTMAMLCSWVCIVGFSALAKTLFEKGIISSRYDVCECFYNKNSSDEDKPKRLDNSRCESDTRLISSESQKQMLKMEKCPEEITALSPDSIKDNPNLSKV